MPCAASSSVSARASEADTAGGPAGVALPGTALPGTALPGTALPGTALPGTALSGSGAGHVVVPGGPGACRDGTWAQHAQQQPEELIKLHAAQCGIHRDSCTPQLSPWYLRHVRVAPYNYGFGRHTRAQTIGSPL